MAKELSSSNAEVVQQLKTVALPCLLNRAACHLKLQQPREAIMDCHSVLQTDSTNTKALFRKGQAHVAVRVSTSCMLVGFKDLATEALSRYVRAMSRQ